MNGVHVFYPNPHRNKEKYDLILHDFDIMVQFLSIMNWRTHNGEITLYTTEEGYDLLAKFELVNLYDYVDTELLELQLEKYDIDQKHFWAASKPLVIQKLKPPFVILDLDLYVEKNLQETRWYNGDVGLFHFEKDSMTYPYHTNLQGFDRVNWPKDWDFMSDPINVALTYFGNQQMLDDYTNLMMQYMNGNKGDSIYDIFYVKMPFTEQRILGELVDKSDYKSEVLITGKFRPSLHTRNSIGFIDVMNVSSAIFEEDEDVDSIHYHSNFKYAESFISHMWGLKRELLNNINFRSSFIRRLNEKCYRDFPQTYDTLRKGLTYWYANNKQKE